MPRPNPRRVMFSEDHLAARVTIERERRGWTLEGLAKRMTDAGCPLASSAVFKIEQGKPRRRIVVDELTAFSRVFGIPVDHLLLDPDIEAEQLVIDKLNDLNTLTVASLETVKKLLVTVREIRDLVKGSKPAEIAMHKYLNELNEIGGTERSEQLALIGDIYGVISRRAPTSSGTSKTKPPENEET